MNKRLDQPVKTICYTDEASDEFSGIRRETKFIGDDYRYIHTNPFWRMAAVIVHRIFVTPAAYLYSKWKFDLKIHGKEKLAPYSHKGCFLFGNHTQVPGDGFMQAMTVFPQKSYVVVNADNVSLKGTEQLMLMIGCLPLPATIKGYRGFLGAMHQRILEGHPIVIYPEAHIWPYYTGIRPFPATSFAYPAKEDKPAFSFTAVYKKRRWRKVPRIEMYVDGPFFPDPTRSAKAAAEKLREEIFEAMKKRAAQSDCTYYRYVKKTEGEELRR